MKKSIQTCFQEFICESEYVRKVRPATLKGYKHCFQTFVRLLPGLSVQLLTPETVTSFFKILQERQRLVGRGETRSGVKKSTIASYWNKLGSFFSWMQLNGHLQKSPFTGMRYPKVIYEDQQYLKKEEIEKILSAIVTQSISIFLLKRNFVIFYLLLLCGLRKEELLYLQIRDIDFERQEITIRAETSKSEKTRKLPMHSILRIHLKEYIQARSGLSTPYLVTSSLKDEGLSDDGLKHFVERMRCASGVSFHLHQFRHTFAVNYLRANKNVVNLQRLLGHRDIKTTMLYLRCLPNDELKEEVEQISLDKLV